MAKKMLDNVGSKTTYGEGLYGAYPWLVPGISDSTASKIAAIHAENSETINWEL